MGIPSYFSYIIKNHSKIIKNLEFFRSNSIEFQHLFMDCNSIIYDSFYELEKRVESGEHQIPSNIEEMIIVSTIEKIKSYVNFICPTGILYIAFDGVAPFAKMDQQRTRRYKSWFSSNIATDKSSKKINWNTVNITPGTKFMDMLSKHIHNEFHEMKNIIISDSNNYGEGEHKIYHYIRNNNLVNTNIAIYGLDADLIMLSILHLKYVNNIYIFRETPEFFMKFIPDNMITSNNMPHFLDILELSNYILVEMDCKYSDRNRITDYIFLCFFLGNDFLPHFPAMNIRTHGITALLDIYRKYIGNYPDRYFITNDKIQWNHLRLFLKEVAKLEHTFLLKEYDLRKKFQHFHIIENSLEEKANILLNAPILYRQEEEYICPTEPYWEQRYYHSLFHNNKQQLNIENICRNYFEGLEWVFKYYTGYCDNNVWKYKYHYPPLFTDLCKYVPYNNEKLIQKNFIKITPEMQLCYVLKYCYLALFPDTISESIKKNHSDLYPIEYKFQWAFCRYFWEAHPILPEITLETVKNMVME